jgi:hypothetical protein
MFQCPVTNTVTVTLQDLEYPEDKVAAALHDLPKVE